MTFRNRSELPRAWWNTPSAEKGAQMLLATCVVGQRYSIREVDQILRRAFYAADRDFYRGQCAHFLRVAYGVSFLCERAGANSEYWISNSASEAEDYEQQTMSEAFNRLQTLHRALAPVADSAVMDSVYMAALGVGRSLGYDRHKVTALLDA